MIFSFSSFKNTYHYNTLSFVIKKKKKKGWEEKKKNKSKVLSVCRITYDNELDVNVNSLLSQRSTPKEYDSIKSKYRPLWKKIGIIKNYFRRERCLSPLPINRCKYLLTYLYRYRYIDSRSLSIALDFLFFFFCRL